MKKPEPFDLPHAQLSKGTTLIEASAGTGKTFAISGLFLRCVLEKGIPIGEILAVTYTVAATAELRDRVRRRLRGALDDLRRREAADEITAEFLKTASPEAVENAIRNLDSAVQNFDEARIFTIHGFCQRVLGESAFESGTLFDMEMLSDVSPLAGEVARDFWRRQFYTGSTLPPRLALAKKKSPADWVKLLKSVRNHPDLRILPPPGAEDTVSLAKLLEGKLGEIAAEWRLNGDEMGNLLATHEDLSRDKRAFHPEVVEKMRGSFSSLAENTEEASPAALAEIFKLLGVNDPKKLKGNKKPPRHAFIDLSAEFSALTDEYFRQFTHEFIGYANSELAQRKERLGVVTFDDLLVRVRDAIRGKGGAALAAAIGAKYRVALIDEFQDTDPVQYEIFRDVFGKGEHHLYFIGDPKQAIYSFRGADVFTYREAAEGAAREFTLNTNWRSEKRLLNAMNLLFETHPSLGAGIEYRKVTVPPVPKPGFGEMEGEGARLRFRYLRSEKEETKFTNTAAGELVCKAVAADIARLGGAGVKLGGRALRQGDIAVLVRYNYEAAEIQKELSARGIKSVLKTEKSVLATPEARELRLLLKGVLEPGRGHLLNTALTTNLVEPKPGDIAVREGDGAEKQERLTQFAEWHAKWKTSGFMAMFRRLLVREKVRERLVRLPGGERMLANFLHLAELLHAAETEGRLTPAGLLLWLMRQEQAAETSTAADEHQLRLESDEDAVLIATIHKSKGLEYPVVFCPYLWKPGEGSSNAETLFHDPDAGDKITLDLRARGDAGEHETAAAGERFEESLRIMYVALTRAKNLCYVYVGDIEDYADSPLARVLDAASSLAPLQMLAEKSGGSIDLTMIDPAADVAQQPSVTPADEAELREKIFHGSIPQERMVASFSSLISGAEDEEGYTAVFTEGEPDPEAGADFSAMARFERSARAGLFWHDLMENLDFQNPAMIDALAREKLISHGFENFPPAVVGAQVRNLLAAPLEGGVRLATIAAAEKRAEVEFSHPIARVTPGELQQVFARHGMMADFSRELGRLDFRPAEGFMRGFIDLIFRHDGRFYIADWKSNWLGERPADYDAPRVHASMLGHFYHLQYHLYTVAADLYLERVLPGYSYEKHFGGVFYIYIRGVDGTTPGRGVFYDRPSAALIQNLRKTLMEGAR